MTDLALVAHYAELRAKLGVPGALRALMAEGDRRMSDAPRAVADVVTVVSARTGVPVDVIMGVSMAHVACRARALCWWILHRRGVAGTVIAQAWKRSRHAVYQLVDAYPARLVRNEVLRATLASIDAELGARKAA